jgi:NAD(P)-dependent dehydrogenase (short-subunit alcohol dehydrogenase family)
MHGVEPMSADPPPANAVEETEWASTDGSADPERRCIEQEVKNRKSIASAPIRGRQLHREPLFAPDERTIQKVLERNAATWGDKPALRYEMVPMPMGGWLRPDDIAELLAWLTSSLSVGVTGQVIFIDGGADAVLRGDSVW